MPALYTVLAVVIIIILLVVFFGGYIAYRLAFKHIPNKDEDIFATLSRHPEFEEVRRKYIESMLALPFEEVRIKSRDGLTLYARYYHVKDGAPLEIQFHGYKSISRRDFSASGTECHIAEYNLLLVDQRSHGMSEGRVISFGIKERFDAIDWVNYARARFGENQKMILYGISMGAATVLMAAGEEELPESVVGIVADCPYSTPIDIIALVAKKLHIPPPVTRIIAPIGARIYGGFSLCETSPKEAVGRARVPILLIHGDADKFVPCYMSEEIAAQNENIRFIKIEGAGHGFGYLVDTKKYTDEVNAFVNRLAK